MQEVIGDLFTQKCDAICITTNGFLKKNGECVMGAGVALQAKKIWPKLPTILGELIAGNGNHVHYLGQIDDVLWLSFPVKYNWFEPADLALIERSCKQLLGFVTAMSWKKVCLPRPGCGNGKLTWEQVKPILEKYFDDRFVVIEINGD